MDGVDAYIILYPPCATTTKDINSYITGTHRAGLVRASAVGVEPINELSNPISKVPSPIIVRIPFYPAIPGFASSDLPRRISNNVDWAKLELQNTYKMCNMATGTLNCQRYSSVAVFRGFSSSIEI